jgi:hypothetical protein
MAIIKLLVELYNQTELKLNLKFEIELLLKALNLDINDIQPSNLLKTRQDGEKNVPPGELSRSATPQREVVQPGLRGKFLETVPAAVTTKFPESNYAERPFSPTRGYSGNLESYYVSFKLIFLNRPNWGV